MNNLYGQRGTSRRTTLKAELQRLKQQVRDRDQFAGQQPPNGVDGPWQTPRQVVDGRRRLAAVHGRRGGRPPTLSNQQAAVDCSRSCEQAAAGLRKGGRLVACLG
jgi:hypothetical protein